MTIILNGGFFEDIRETVPFQPNCYYSRTAQFEDSRISKKRLLLKYLSFRRNVFSFTTIEPSQ